MSKHEYTDVTTQALGQFGNAAHRAIELYRESGERIAAAAAERWDIAFEQASAQLDAETRKNAKHFRTVFAGWWNRALALSADGATIAVDTAIGAAIAGVERMAEYRQARA